MRTILLAAALLLAALPSRAGTLLLRDFDVDTTTYVCPVLCTPTIGAGPGLCPGPGYTDARKITTSAASSATVTAVSSNGAFGLAAVGDVIVISPDGAEVTVPTLRRITGWASANSVTVDSVITIASAGATFRLWNLVTGTGAAGDGWFTMLGTGDGEVFLSFDQISATGGVDYKVEGRMCTTNNDYCTGAEALSGPTNLATGSAAVDRVAFDKEYVDQLRACFKVGTSDDDGVLVAANTDDLDWNEYVNSYTVATDNDLDMVEDAAGTPITCNADVAAGTYTGAALAALITTEMNDDVANCDGTLNNTYTATYSTTTHKFTIARTTGTATIGLLWATGTNTATSMKTLLGYTNADDTGGTSYAADSATGETLFTQNLDAGTYSGTSACVELAAEMNATASVVATYSCSYSSATDKITISATGITQLMLLWNTGTNTATSAGPQLGFPTSADSTGALTYTGAALDSFNASEVEKINVLFNLPAGR